MNATTDGSVGPRRERVRDRRILVAMTGSVACCKACGLVSALVQEGADVRAIMTRSATEFVGPLTLEALTGAPVGVEMFGGAAGGDAHRHIELSRFAEIVAVVPATANIIGKIAGGIADDLVSATLLSAPAPVLVAPAMNTRMLENPAVRRNLRTLEEFGVHVVDPDGGYLSCGEEGVGRLPDPEILIEEIVFVLRRRDDLEGRKVLVGAGRTEEPFDPIRFLSNRSSGKMGRAVAATARRFGAQVTLVTGPSVLSPPRGVRVVAVRTAAEMAGAMAAEAGAADLIVMAAAVSDFTPASCSERKIRRGEGRLDVTLEATGDILRGLARSRKAGAVVVGFAMETEDMEENALRKLREKEIDLIVANDPFEPGTGFGEDFIRAVLLDREGGRREMPVLEKEILAERILEDAGKMLAG